jgi:hypothetical protein
MTSDVPLAIGRPSSMHILHKIDAIELIYAPPSDLFHSSSMLCMSNLLWMRRIQKLSFVEYWSTSLASWPAEKLAHRLEELPLSAARPSRCLQHIDDWHAVFMACVWHRRRPLIVICGAAQRGLLWAELSHWPPQIFVGYAYDCRRRHRRYSSVLGRFFRQRWELLRYFSSYA